MPVSPSSEKITLADGTIVDLVPMQPSDAERLVRFHQTLSPDTTYLRFFSFHPELSEGELYRFTHVDHTNREAVVAVVAGEIVGVARFDRHGDSSEAEVAFVLADSWQGRGLGKAMFAALAERARAVGVDRFVAETLPHNRPMIGLFRSTGLPSRFTFEGGAVHVELDLSKAGGPEARSVP